MGNTICPESPSVTKKFRQNDEPEVKVCKDRERIQSLLMARQSFVLLIDKITHLILVYLGKWVPQFPKERFSKRILGMCILTKAELIVL